MKKLSTKKWSALLIMLTLSVASVFSQSPEKKWAIGLQGGFNQYAGDLGNGIFRFDNQALYGFGGLSLGYNVSEHWDLELGGTYGALGHIESDNPIEANRFLHDMWTVSLTTKYNFFKYDDVKFRPFLHLGVGYAGFLPDDKYSERPRYGVTIFPVGGGVSFKVSPTVSIVLKETFMFSAGDNVELQHGGPYDSYMQHSLGVVFNLGNTKDRDNDGVSDKRDDCPDLFGVVENRGCPSDRDNDGVYDKDDACPDAAGTANGCPDADGDGVADKDDPCPNVAGPVNGCPDADNDGVADKDDECPYSAGTVNGCPDSDGDGVADKDDPCPNAAGTANGCPDGDGDGVADKDDDCPNEKGSAENNGCPEMLGKTIACQFDFNKAIVDQDCHATFEEFATYMKKNPNVKLTITGHTDSKGSDAVNQIFSERRAVAVKNYFVKKLNIPADSIKTQGKGEKEPVASNDTAEGRAKNRRVDLLITK